MGAEVGLVVGAEAGAEVGAEVGEVGFWVGADVGEDEPEEYDLPVSINESDAVRVVKTLGKITCFPVEEVRRIERGAFTCTEAEYVYA